MPLTRFHEISPLLPRRPPFDLDQYCVLPLVLNLVVISIVI